MDAFLESYHLPKLSHEPTEHLNKPVSETQNKSIIQSLPAKKNLGPDSFTVELYNAFQIGNDHNSSSTIQTNRKRGNWKSICIIFRQLKINLSYNAAIPLLGRYKKKKLIHTHEKAMYTSMFTATQSTIAKIWKQSRCPPKE